MASQNIKSASEVLTGFLKEQAGDADLDQGTISAIVGLRGEGKLTRINLLRKLEDARKAAMKATGAPEDGSS